MNLRAFGAWLNPVYDEATRTRFVVEAEALGYATAWLGMGSRAMPDLDFVERALDATRTIIVATAIVNMWTNDAATIARSYQRIAAKHSDRFLLGVGIGHPESIPTYTDPLEMMVAYLDELDANAVPRDRRVLAALGDRALRLSAQRAAGAHPYLVVPEHTRHARQILGPSAILAPEHKVVVSTDVEHARAIGRGFLREPYFHLSNYVNNLVRRGFTPDDFADGGSDRIIDALVLHGTPEQIRSGLVQHLDAGANHVSVQVLTLPGADPMPGYRSLARVLL
jgi:probable F420-dependent oxidoreductase